MPILPSKVVLYIPTRTGNKAFILMDVVQEGTPLAWSLKPVETLTELKWATPANPSITTYTGQFVVRNCDGILLNKQIKNRAGISLQDTAGTPIIVISMAQHTTVFGSHNLKPNVYIPPLAIPPPPSGADAPVPPTPIPPTPKQKKTLTPVGVGGLNPFVAKQLFELAVLRKEMCPITAEEFSEGNTAAMPCGHLFMRFAIEESFKKERDKCPWCRQTGRPTYV